MGVAKFRASPTALTKENTISHTKTEYLEGTSIQLDLWGKQFRAFERHLAERTRGPAMVATHEKLERLKSRRRHLKRRLQEAAFGTSALAWEDVRDQLEDAVADFRGLALEVHDSVKGT